MREPRDRAFSRGSNGMNMALHGGVLSCGWWLTSILSRALQKLPEQAKDDSGVDAWSRVTQLTETLHNDELLHLRRSWATIIVDRLSC